MLIRSIEAARMRVIAVRCPICSAAPQALCTEKIFNSAGIQTREMNLFHNERIQAAQTLAERNADTLLKLQYEINAHPIK